MTSTTPTPISSTLAVIIPFTPVTSTIQPSAQKAEALGPLAVGLIAAASFIGLLVMLGCAYFAVKYVRARGGNDLEKAALERQKRLLGNNFSEKTKSTVTQPVQRSEHRGSAHETDDNFVEFSKPAITKSAVRQAPKKVELEDLDNITAGLDTAVMEKDKTARETFEAVAKEAEQSPQQEEDRLGEAEVQQALDGVLDVVKKSVDNL